MKRKPRSGTANVAEVTRLLKRYDCPMQYHAVRARFLGCIACPSVDTHPIQALEALWDGVMPEFERIDDANELMQGLINGIWNPLTIDLSDNKLFRLKKMRAPGSSAGMKRFAQTRVDEIDAFVDGLFDSEDAIELPDLAREAVEELGELLSLFGAIVQFADEPETEAEFSRAVLHAQQLSYIAEQEINEVVAACGEARHAMLARPVDGDPVLH